jgi:hypothetical protein
MCDPFPFKWRHFEVDTILCAVRGDTCGMP